MDDDHAVSTRVYQSDQPSQESLDRHCRGVPGIGGHTKIAQHV